MLYTTWATFRCNNVTLAYNKWNTQKCNLEKKLRFAPITGMDQRSLICWAKAYKTEKQHLSLIISYILPGKMIPCIFSLTCCTNRCIHVCTVTSTIYTNCYCLHLNTIVLQCQVKQVFWNQYMGTKLQSGHYRQVVMDNKGLIYIYIYISK